MKPQVIVTRVGHWARQSGIALLEVVTSFMEAVPDYPFEFLFLSVHKKGYNPDSMKRMPYSKFASYYATVFWPWDVMMLLFDELYSMTMPLLLPANRWMYRIMHHALTQTEMNWWHLRAQMVSIPNFMTYLLLRDCFVYLIVVTYWISHLPPPPNPSNHWSCSTRCIVNLIWL